MVGGGRSRDQFIKLLRGDRGGGARRAHRAEGVEGRAERRARHDRARRSLAFRLGAEWGGPAGRALHRPRRPPRRAARSDRPASASAPTAYTGPDCPPDMLDVGGIRRATTRPSWLPRAAATRSGSKRRRRVGDLATLSVSTRAAAGPVRLHVLTDPRPPACAARLSAASRAAARVGLRHWRSRDVYEHQRDVEDDFDGYGRNALPLDAIVIDSPWETQYNTWEPNPHQFDDFQDMVTRFRAHGVRTVVWVTPWSTSSRSTASAPPAPSRSASTASRRPTTSRRARRHFVKTADGEPFVARWWMGTGSPIDFTSPRRTSGGASWPSARCGWAWRASRPTTARATASRPTCASPTPHGAEAAWAYGLYRRSMQRALDEVHPGAGVLFGRSGWTGQQGVGVTWGGDQASDFWSLETLVTATRRPPRAASRTGPTTWAATSASGWSTAVPRSCCCAGRGSAASPR